MRLSDIVPYERNARDNARAVPKVAESIREFGFRGTIVLRSHGDPTIVCGHTRVAALKQLGWTEIPDELITWCDDLTDDEVKALRIADNKTGDIATYNRSMLREEVRGLKDFDMARFGCEFKSAHRPVGAERLRTDRAYNLDLVSRADCGPDGFPALSPCDARPTGAVPCNYAKTTPEGARAGRMLHFFKDDYQFERFWTSPERYLEYLRGYECVLTPDFSLYMDMPAPMQAWNRYRSLALGLWWQRNGVPVVPTLSWAGPATYSFCFAGVPSHATVATSTVGVAADGRAREVFHDGMAEAMRRLEPSRVIVYGADVGFDFGDAEVISISASVRGS